MGKNRIFFARWTPAIYWSLVSKPVSQDIQSICYCLHTGIFCLDTCDLVVAGVRISISPKYLYLYLELSGSTIPVGCIPPPAIAVFSCHTCPPATHAPLPCIPPTMHAPHHTCPLPCTPLCHACPLPCTPPAMHDPCHTCPQPCHAHPSVDRILDTRL